jgi:hypothetical protein
VTLYWFLTATALVLAALALARARGVSRRVERLAESYWELRYENGQLRARLARLEGQPDAEGTPVAERAPAAPAAFIPLSTLKR